VAGLLAVRASGWNPVYGLAVGLALGGILPGELNPYQYLPLLPLVLMVLVVAIRNARWAYVAAMAAGLLMWWREPCLLPFPNLWTVGALILFAVSVLAYRDFRGSPEAATAVSRSADESGRASHRPQASSSPSGSR
jgi:hypothetical protein